MKFLFFMTFILVANPVFANKCYELSADGKTWDDESVTLCVSKNTDGTSEFKINLMRKGKDIAIYFLNSVPGLADAMTFGVDPMRGSILNDSVAVSIGYGEVHIGNATYFYKE